MMGNKNPCFAGGHLRYQQGAWRDDDGDPVDCVEVVRCKECAYYEIGKDYLPYCNNADGGIADYPMEDDFCSYGKRRADDGR